MTIWNQKAELSSIVGADVGLWPSHVLDSNGSDRIALEKGAQSAHFRYYWTEDSSVTSSDENGQNTTSHHIESVTINSATFAPFDLVQSLANTLECCWEMLFTGQPIGPQTIGGFGFVPLTSLRSLTPDGRVPVYIFDLPFVGKAAPECWLQFNRSVVRNVDPQFFEKRLALLQHDAPMHELFHLVKIEYLGPSEGGLNWIYEGMSEWSQRMWRGYRSGIIDVGTLFASWTGKGSILDDNSEDHIGGGYHFHHFWDYIGRRFSQLSYGARVRTPLCDELDARKDLYPGVDVLKDILEDRRSIRGEPGSNAEKIRHSLTNVAQARGHETNANDIEWSFLTQDWLGQDIIAARADEPDQFQLFCKKYPERSDTAKHVGALDIPTIMTANFQEAENLNWTALKGQVTSAPAIVNYNNYGRDQIHMFARGIDGSLWTNVKLENMWIGWHSLSSQLNDATITSPPVAVVFPNLRKRGTIFPIPFSEPRRELHIFARGRNGQLWTAHFDGMRWWGGHTFPMVVLRGHPAVGVHPSFIQRPRDTPLLWDWVLHLFVWAEDGTLQMARYNRPSGAVPGYWSSLETLGSLEYTSSPACALLQDGNRFELWVMIRDGSSSMRAFVLDETDQWQGLPEGTHLGGSLQSAPTAAIMNHASGSSLYVLARRNWQGGIVRCFRRAGSWSDWTNIN